MSVELITFGCRLNIVESETIRDHAAVAALEDVVIVNTCAVTAEAVRQARQAIRRIKRERPRAQIVVTGCAAQTQSAQFAAMPEVDRVLGNEEKLSAAAWAKTRDALRTRDALQEPAAKKVAVSDIMTASVLAPHPIAKIDGHTRAFVQIQNGCDHRCTFCVIPFGRGNSRSLPINEVVIQARGLVDNGYREIVLTGVDITSYGTDLAGTPRLGTLVKRVLAEVPELERLRLSSIDSVEVDDDLYEAIANETRLMPHLHLSLQAGDDIILKRMKRRHTRAQAIAFCEHVRRLRPAMALSADIIAGFPTESEEMFQRSLDLVDACGLTSLHVFPFSPRPGTPAARMPQLERAIIKERAQRLREKGNALLHAHLDAQIGQRRQVLTEMNNTGHTEHFTPVRFNKPVKPGLFVDTMMIGHDGRHLMAG